MGPRLSAGKNVNAPTMRMTQTRRAANNGPVTGKVPSEGGTRFFRPRLPAIASIGTIMKNRPMSVSSPIALLYQSVFAFRPAKADPLFAAPSVNAYRISESPCGPGFATLDVPKPGDTAETAVRPSITSGR